MRQIKRFSARGTAIAMAVLLGATVSAQTPAGDPLGVVKIGKGQPVVIGYWLALSGPAAQMGADSRRAIELAIDAKGNILGHPIQLVGEDGACDAQRADDAAAKLAARPALLAVVGPSCSHEALAGAPVLWKTGIPTVSPSNTAVQLTAPDRGPGLGGYLRTAHNDRVQGRVAAEFAYGALKVSKVATVKDDGPYAQALEGAFTEAFKRLGGNVIAQETLGTEGVKRAALDRLAAADPELVYYPLMGQSAAPLTREIKGVPALAKSILMTSDGTFVPQFLDATGAAAKGLYQSSPDVTPGRLGPRYGAFVAAYQEKYGQKPRAPFHAQAHDATRMILGAIEAVAKRDADGSLIVGRNALRDALFATRDLSGASGTLSCDIYGDCADPKIAVYQVQSVEYGTWDPGRNPKKVYP